MAHGCRSGGSRGTPCFSARRQKPRLGGKTSMRNIGAGMIRIGFWGSHSRISKGPSGNTISNDSILGNPVLQPKPWP